MRRICVIVPIHASISKDDTEMTMKDLQVRISRIYLPSAPVSIESEYDVACAAAPVAEAAQDAERDGHDAVVVDCFADPGVRAARELVDIVVCGAGETSMLVAAGLAGCFAVVTVLDNIVPIIRDSARRIGVADRLISTRSIGVPVQSLPDVDLGTLISAEAASAVDDGASAVVLGCTGLVGIKEVVEGKLQQSVGHYVPVIDASVVPILYATTLVNSGLSHSKVYYRFPPEKEGLGRQS